MLQFDMTLLIIWYVVPFGLLGLRAVYAGYRAWQKRKELHRLEEKITPFTSKF
jgi:cell division protein FtsL